VAVRLEINILKAWLLYDSKNWWDKS